MKVVCTGDTHGLHENLNIPDGDLFIHVGDISDSGRLEDYLSFNRMLSTLSHKNKIILSGNHDLLFELKTNSLTDVLSNGIYLKHGLIEIDSLKIWGSSWQPELFGRSWLEIPDHIDVLITHIPPFGVLDNIHGGKNLGSKSLLKIIHTLNPKFVVFGHVHESYGIEKRTYNGQETCFINCSAVVGFQKKLNPPIVFNI